MRRGVWTGVCILLFALAGCGGSGVDPAGLAASALPAAETLLKAGSLAPQDGFWWNPAESGRGYAIEVQGSQVILGAYMYEASGAATWTLATLQQQADGSYAGPLGRYTGGQSLLGAYQAPAVTTVGTATLTLRSATAGTLQVASAAGTSSTPIERLVFGLPTFAPVAVNVQSGLWWNPAESGRGYFVEVQSGTVAVASFMYDSAGQPTWYLTTAQLQDGVQISGPLQQYAGGQALGGSYRPATALPQSAGSVTFTGTSLTTAELRLPDGRGLPLARTFGGGADPCAGVRSGFAANIETTVAGAGTGGDGSGAGGTGGAAAGGGLGKVLGGLLRVVDLSDNSLVGEAVTDSLLGLVTVKTCTRPGPFLLTLEGRAGARYYDEALGRYVDFEAGRSLHALVDQWDEHVGVSPLTEAAYRYALNQFKAGPADIAGGRAPLRSAGNLTGLTRAQAKMANDVVLTEVNRRLTANYALTSARTLPTPIDAGSGANALQDTRYGRAAAVNGGLVQAAADYNPALGAPALAFTEDFARDLTDGRIDGFALDGSPAAVSYESVRLPLAGNIGTSSIATRFGATTLAAQLTVNERSWMQVTGVHIAFSEDPTVSCAGFNDDVALLSDGSVTVVRRFPTNENGVCSFKNDAAEQARAVKTRNFLTGIKSLSRGGSVVMAVRTDGTVVGWGDNYCGSMHPKLANGIYATPQVIPGLRDVTAVSSDGGSTIVRDSQGKVYTWGSALYGAGATSTPAGWVLCDSSPDGSTRWQPTAINQYALANVTEVASSVTAFFALTADGTLYGWGGGAFGLLANSDGTVRNDILQAPSIDQPTPIAGLGRVRQILPGFYSMFALQADGTVMAWGNDDGQLLGFGTRRFTTRPAKVEGLDNVASMAAAFGGMRLLRNDGSVWTWGWDFQKRVGRVWTFGSSRPAPISVPEPIRLVTGRGSGFTVYFSSGRISSEVNATTDESGAYR